MDVSFLLSQDILSQSNLMRQEQKKMSLKKKILISISIALITSGAIAGAVMNHANTVVQPPALPETLSLARKNLQNTISITGNLESAGKRVITSEQTDQKVVKLYVKAGDRVKEGDVIAALDTTPIDDKLKILRDSVSFAIQKAEIEKAIAERNLDSTLEGSEIEKARARKAIDDANSALEKAKQESSQAKSLYEQAKSKIKDKESSLKHLRDESEEAKKSSKERAALLEEMKRKREEKQNEKPGLEDNKAQKEAGLKEAKSAYEEAVAIFEDMAADDTQTAEDIEAAREEMEQKKSLMQNAEKEAEAANTQLSALAAELQNLQESEDNTQKAYAKAEEEFRQKTEAAAAAESAYAAAKDTAQAKESAYKQTDALITSVGTEYQKSLQSSDDINRNSTKSIADLQDSLKSLEITEAGSNLQEKMDIKKYEHQLEACVIKATADGIVTSLGIQEGNVYKGGEIATIQDTEHLVATALADQFDVMKLKNGMNVEIQPASSDTLKITGKIVFISPIPKSQQAAGQPGEQSNASVEYPVEISLDSSDARLRLGMKAKLNIVTEEAKNVYAVPYNCIATDEQGNSTITVLEDEAERTIQVIQGLATDYFVEIRSRELKAGMQVIIPAAEGDTETNSVNGVAQ